MADNEMNHRGRPAGPDDEDPATAAVLRAEIHFWQEMIDTRSDRLPPEAVERMQFAKALAETRLVRCRDNSIPMMDNVFCLDQARRKIR